MVLYMTDGVFIGTVVDMGFARGGAGADDGAAFVVFAVAAVDGVGAAVDVDVDDVDFDVDSIALSAEASFRIFLINDSTCILAVGRLSCERIFSMSSASKSRSWEGEGDDDSSSASSSMATIVGIQQYCSSYSSSQLRESNLRDIGFVSTSVGCEVRIFSTSTSIVYF